MTSLNVVIIFAFTLFTFSTKIGVQAAVVRHIEEVEEQFSVRYAGVNHVRLGSLQNVHRNRDRFSICLQIYENTMDPTGGYLERYIPSMETRQVTMRCRFAQNCGEKTIEVILCPLSRFTFRNFPLEPVGNFYITDSVNENCYYKLRLNSELDVNTSQLRGNRENPIDIYNINIEICLDPPEASMQKNPPAPPSTEDSDKDKPFFILDPAASQIDKKQKSFHKFI